MTYSSDKEWLEKCHPEHLPVPPFDRYVYMLEGHVVKKSLRPGELGFDGYQPDISTIAQRDENEIRTMEIVRQYTNIPVPKLIYQGNGQVNDPSNICKLELMFVGSTFLSESQALQYLKALCGTKLRLASKKASSSKYRTISKSLRRFPILLVVFDR